MHDLHTDERLSKSLKTKIPTMLVGRALEADQQRLHMATDRYKKKGFVRTETHQVRSLPDQSCILVIVSSRSMR